MSVRTPNPQLEYGGDNTRKRNRSITIRCTDEERQRITSKAERYGLSLSDYIIRCATEKKIVVIEGLQDVLKAQKAIGSNLNQIALLGNMGRLKSVRLDELIEQHTAATKVLCEIANAVK